MEEVLRRTSLVPLAFPCFVYCLIGVDKEGLLDYQGGRGSCALYGGTFARSYSVSRKSDYAVNSHTKSECSIPQRTTSRQGKRVLKNAIVRRRDFKHSGLRLPNGIFKGVRAHHGGEGKPHEGHLSPNRVLDPFVLYVIPPLLESRCSVILCTRL